MFEEITRETVEKRAGRRLAYVVASAAFQLLFLTALVLIGDQLRAAATGSAPLVAVKFIRPTPSPSPAPPPPGSNPHPHPGPLPRTATPAPSPAPVALTQPKEVPEQPPAPSAAPESEPASGPGVADDGTGGVPGGSPGGVIGGSLGGQGQAAGGASGEEGPVFPGSGARRPALASTGCLRDSLRLPAGLQGIVSGSVEVKFAVQVDGSLTDFQVLSAVPDQRISDAIRRAMESCRWIAGADAAGRPTWFWSTMRLRFQSD